MKKKDNCIRIPRDFVNRQCFKNANELSVLLYCIASASKEVEPINGVTVNRGQLYVLRYDLAKATGLSEYAANKALLSLFATGELTVQCLRRGYAGYLITVNNFEVYQDGDGS